MKKLISTIAIISSLSTVALSQFSKDVYPIGEDADINYKLVQIEPGEILFEANPIVRYSFVNNFIDSLMNQYHLPVTYYLEYTPQLRMFDVTSKPVQAPSQRISFGFQGLWRFNDINQRSMRHKRHSFIWMYQTGHYSNGQQNCAFDENAIDGSEACQEAYAAITDETDLSSILNRRSGNFSTNFTRLLFAFRFDSLRRGYNAITHQFTFGTTIYHNPLLYFLDIGGFTIQDIRIYGRSRFHLWYEYQRTFGASDFRRISFQARGEYIVDPHPSVEPMRLEFRTNAYLFEDSPDFGFFIQGDWGHDNYNFRFLDSGFALSLGITWDAFGVIQW